MSTCTWNIACPLPPIVAKPISGRSSRVMMDAISVWNGRLPGARTLGCSGSTVKWRPRFCRQNPVPGGTTPEPNALKRLWITLTMLPCPSATTKPVVSPSGSPAV